MLFERTAHSEKYPARCHGDYFAASRGHLPRQSKRRPEVGLQGQDLFLDRYLPYLLRGPGWMKYVAREVRTWLCD